MSNNLVLLTFLSTNYSALKLHWQKYSKLKSSGKSGSDRPFKGDLGGKIVLFDLLKGVPLWEKHIDSPSGVYFEKGKIYVNSINLGKVFVLSYKTGKIVGELNHKYLNKPHSLVRTKNGFLIASSGLDSIVEINDKGEEMYKFFLFENGYELDQFGKKRYVDKEINHQQIVYPSLHQTTHVNYARYKDEQEKCILCTLFHTGELVEINKEKNSIKVLLSGLRNPHTINDFSKSAYLICDTKNNRVVIVCKKSFKIIDSYAGPFSWVQDAVRLGKKIIVADADNHRLCEVDVKTHKLINIHDFSEEDRIYQILPFNYQND